MVLGAINAGGPGTLQVVHDGRCGGDPGQGRRCNGSRFRTDERPVSENKVTNDSSGGGCGWANHGAELRCMHSLRAQRIEQK